MVYWWTDNRDQEACRQEASCWSRTCIQAGTRGPSGSLMDRFFTARGEAAGDSRSKTIQNKKEKLDADIHKYKQPPVLEEREDPLHFCVDGTCLFRR